jgi:hypothetical protein
MTIKHLFEICRDWNGSKRGHVYKFLRSQGFVSSYDTAHHYTDSDADAHKVIYSTKDSSKTIAMSICCSCYQSGNHLRSWVSEVTCMYVCVYVCI